MSMVLLLKACPSTFLTVSRGIFSSKRVVVDDCLVDLDPERKKLAIDMIKEFSKKH